MLARCMKLLHINDHNYDSLFRIHLFIVMNTLFCREQEMSARETLYKNKVVDRGRGGGSCIFLNFQCVGID